MRDEITRYNSVIAFAGSNPAVPAISIKTRILTSYILWGDFYFQGTIRGCVEYERHTIGLYGAGEGLHSARARLAGMPHSVH